MSEQAGRYQRSFRGMIGAMLVLLGVVAAFVAFRSLVRDDPADPVKPVEYLSPAAFAADEVDFTLLYPKKLPDGWMATSVEFRNIEEQAWHLGILTEEREYIGIEQDGRPLSAMVEDYVDEEAEQGDDVTINGVTWETWTDPGDGEDTAFVREDGDVTNLIVGTVGEDTLSAFVESMT